MLPNHPNQLLQMSLDKLSHELHDKMDSYLVQMKQEQQILLNDTLSQLIPTLLTKLTPIIEQEVQKQNQPMLDEVEACLNELRSTNQQQLKMLKLGREEYQLLQTKMKSALTQLESIPSDDDSEIQQSMATLTTSVSKLQQSIQQSNNEQQDLENTVAELEALKTTLQTKVAELTKLQQDLVNSLSQFQPLLKP